jgi:hypothetical protein
MDAVVQRQVEKGRAAIEKQNALILYFYSNEAWLNPETAARVEDFIRAVRVIDRIGADL